MNKISKSLLLYLACAFLLVAFAGCGKERTVVKGVYTAQAEGFPSVTILAEGEPLPVTWFVGERPGMILDPAISPGDEWEELYGTNIPVAVAGREVEIVFTPAEIPDSLSFTQNGWNIEEKLTKNDNGYTFVLHPLTKEQIEAQRPDLTPEQIMYFESVEGEMETYYLRAKWEDETGTRACVYCFCIILE